MTSVDQISRQITDLVADVLAIDPPPGDLDLIEEGYIDSLAVVSLIGAIEEEFGVQLPLVEFGIDDFRTANRISAYVAKSLAGGGPA